MTDTTGASTSFLASLRAVLPPARVLHVGVGSGVGTMHLWRTWGVEHAWLIDATAASQTWLEALAADHPHWHVAAATLASSAGDVAFFHASNPAESGLIAPSALRPLWPNLQESASEQHQAQTLDALLGARAASSPDGDWLLVDCLSALDILQGAQQTLEECSVVWVRTLRTALAPAPDRDNGTLPASLAQLQTLLEPRGFRCVHLCDCTHPAMAEAIFCRDWRGALQRARTAQYEQAGLLEDRHKRIVQVQQALAVQTATALQQRAAAQDAVAAHQDSLAAMAKQHQQEMALLEERLCTLKEACGAQVASVEAAASALREQFSASEAQVARLTQERNEHAWQAAAAQQRIDELEQKAAQQLQRLGVCEAELRAQQEEAGRLQALAADSAAALAASGQSQAALQRSLDALAESKQALEMQLADAGLAHQAELVASQQALEMQLADAGLAHQAELAASQLALEVQRTDSNLVLEAHRADSERALEAQAAQSKQALEAQAADSMRTLDAQRAQSQQAMAAQLAERASEHANEQDDHARRQTRLEQEIAGLKQAAAARDEEIDRRDAEIVLLGKRHQQLADELLRAEAQIDLIKDVLLREQGL